jgi:hypothetical protein
VKSRRSSRLRLGRERAYKSMCLIEASIKCVSGDLRCKAKGLTELHQQRGGDITCECMAPEMRY